MQLLHFELLKPICPVCLLGGLPEARLRILHVERGDSTRIVEGALSCSSCKFEYPILDGIPLIMANVRDVVRNQLPALLQRTDVSPYAASFLADCGRRSSAGLALGLASVKGEGVGLTAVDGVIPGAAFKK